jgi:ElaB/YqjD/DUF883 family membrane-anchored ribosome-binding protein
MATSTHEPSVAELRRDADRTRAHLTGTVEELRSQVADTATHVREAVAPSTIKRQVKDYVRESSEDMVQSLQRRARENPLQAVAVGAAVAYPVWGLLRSIPAPLLLIGAGLALSRSSAVREASDEAIARARRAASDAADTIDEWRESAGAAVDRASDMVTSAKDRASDMVSSTKDRVSNAVTDAQTRVGNTLSDAQTRVGNTYSDAQYRAGNTASDARSSMTDMTDAAMERGSRAFNTASDKITSFAGQAKDTLGSAYEQNPLLVAGIGLAIGAVIASSLPTTKTENKLFGDANDALRRKAADAVDEGLEAAKQAAGNVVGTATQEGSSTANDLARKAKTVAERGLDAALGTGSSSNTASNTPSKTTSTTPSNPTSSPTT